MCKLLTKEEVQKRLDDMGCEIDIIGHYRNTFTKCLCRCRKDGYEWMVIVSSLLSGSGCTKCAGQVRLTNEIVDTRLIGRNIRRLDDVNGTDNKIRWQCEIDNFIWSTTPSSVLDQLSGCTKCAGQVRLTNEIVDTRLIGRNIRRLDDVNGTDNKIRWQCEIDGHIWSTRPYKIINRKTGCPRCSGSILLSNEIVDSRLHGRNIRRLDNIINSSSKIRWQCEIDNFIWSTTPNSVLNNLSGCPACACSKRNNYIAKYLKDNGYTFIREAHFTTCRYKKELPFDFFIPSKRILIEADGIQHYEYVEHFHKNSSLDVQLEKDYIKTQWAKRNKYILIRLSHDQPEEEILASLANIKFYKDY